MKRFLVPLLPLFISCCTEPIDDTLSEESIESDSTGVAELSEQTNSEQYIETLLEERADRDNEYRDTALSPLNPDSIATFQGLNYFPIDTAFNIKARFTKELGEVFTMPTSSGKLKEFRQYGIASFWVAGITCQLHVYQNMKLLENEEYEDYVFVPFTDNTTGVECYGGGRYIETTLPEGDYIMLDFNRCFNPYCHYGDGWNCPIPPAENVLNVAIVAGETLLYSDH